MSYRDLVLADNPTHYWPMKEAGGTVTADLISLGGQGGSISTSLGYKGVTATDGSASINDVANQGFIALQQQPYLPNPPGIGPYAGFSMEVWLWQLGLTGTYQELLMYGPNGNDTELLVDVTGHATLTQRGGSGLVAAPAPVTLNAWHHIVGVASSKSPATGPALLYVDGALAATSPAVGYQFPISGTFAIGLFTDRTQPLNGYIGSVAIYAYQLSAAQVAAHAAAAEFALSAPFFQGGATFQQASDASDQLAAILRAVRKTY